MEGLTGQAEVADFQVEVVSVDHTAVETVAAETEDLLDALGIDLSDVNYDAPDYQAFA